MKANTNMYTNRKYSKEAEAVKWIMLEDQREYHA